MRKMILSNRRWIFLCLALAVQVAQGQQRHENCPPSVSPYPTETAVPSPSPSELPSFSSSPTSTPQPTATASEAPTTTPEPTNIPTESPAPSPSPSEIPSLRPSESLLPSLIPSDWPSIAPSAVPTTSPSSLPTIEPTTSPSSIPSDLPSLVPSFSPTLSKHPTVAPTATPSTAHPSVLPSYQPSKSPSSTPSDSPSLMPSKHPSSAPSSTPTEESSTSPTMSFTPSSYPSLEPTTNVTPQPISFIYVASPITLAPSNHATAVPTHSPSLRTIDRPSKVSTSPSFSIADLGLDSGTIMPTEEPSFLVPTPSPTEISKESKKNSSKEEAMETEAENTPSTSPMEQTILPSSRPNLPDSSNDIETLEQSIIVTASSSFTLTDQNTTLNLRKIAVFESIALQFLTDHYSRIMNEAAIKFESVKVTSQVQKSNAAVRERRLQAEDTKVNDDIAESITLPLSVDVDVLFDVAANILPGKDLGFMDFQWVVETLFDVNEQDFHERLEKTGEFKPVGIMGEEKTTNSKADTESTSQGAFSTWMVVSLGAVAFSVFLTAILVTGAVSRSRRNRIHTNHSTSRDFGASASVYEDDIRSLSPSMRTGLSAGFDEESLDGLKLVRSASSLKSGRPTVGRRSMKDEYGSIIIPVEETNVILKKLSSANSEKETGLNARMRKRLIEREVQTHGQDAGLSMEAILKATSSFNSDDEEYQRHDTGLRPSPINVGEGHSDHNRTKKPTNNGLFSTWFGQRRETVEEDDDLPQDSRTHFTLNSALFHGPNSNANRDDARKDNRGLSLPSRAEVITVGESVRGEQYPISTTNWNVWDSPEAVQMPNIPELPGNDEGNNSKSPFKFVKKMGMLAMGRRVEASTHHKKQLSDEYDHVEHHAFGISADAADNGDAKSARKKILKASSPLWMSGGPDNVTGIVHLGPGDSRTVESRGSSISSFPISPRLAQRPPRHTSVGTDATSSTTSAWKRPGKITTEFESTPLKRRLARARLDPPVRLNAIRYHPQAQEDDSQTYQSGAQEQYPGHGRENVPVLPADSRHPSNLPHSSVRLVKKNSSLSKMSKSRKPYRVEEYTTVGVPSKGPVRRSGSGRIGASPMVEMSVASNDNAMILGSLENDYGGLELEWGLTI